MTAPAIAPPDVTVNQYRNAQDVITRKMVIPTTAALKTLSKNPEISNNDWFKLLLLLFPIMMRSRKQSALLASAYYASLSKQGTAPPIGVPFYDIRALDYALTRTFRSLIQPGIGRDERVRAVLEGAGAVGRHVEMSGRDWMRHATYGDRTALGWARVARGASTCSFCLLLISRGPVYHSAESAGLASDGQMNRWHDHCDCVATPVFDRDDWQGRDQYIEAERLYIEATRGVHGTQNKLQAFRAAVEAA